LEGSFRRIVEEERVAAKYRAKLATLLSAALVLSLIAWCVVCSDVAAKVGQYWSKHAGENFNPMEAIDPGERAAFIALTLLAWLLAFSAAVL